MSTDVLAGAPAQVIEAYKRLGGKLKAFALALPMAGSQTEAALKAGYAEKTAKANASQFAANPDVRIVHDYLVGSVVRTAEITFERCMAELAKLAFGDPAALFGEDGALLPPHEWPKDAGAMIAEVQQIDLYAGVGDAREKIGVTNKIKFADKHAALRTALQLIDAFPDKKKKVEHTHRVGVVVVPAKTGQGQSAGLQDAIEGAAQRLEQPQRKGNAPAFMVRRVQSLAQQD